MKPSLLSMMSQMLNVSVNTRYETFILLRRLHSSEYKFSELFKNLETYVRGEIQLETSLFFDLAIPNVKTPKNPGFLNLLFPACSNCTKVTVSGVFQIRSFLFSVTVRKWPYPMFSNEPFPSRNFSDFSGSFPQRF